jgi:hypothetical protein
MKKRHDKRQAAWDANWEEMFAALVRYKRWHRHCRVPPRWEPNPALAEWVRLQRAAQRARQLRLDRFRRLERLGFVWNTLTDAWERWFAQLEAFRKRFGHCSVPRCWAENPTLASWVHSQRQHKNHGELSAERIRRLEAIGFEWQPQTRLEMERGAYARHETWERMFTALVRFKERHGHCRVPRGRPGNWVFVQRHRRRAGGLLAERIRRLDEIGFTWELTDLSKPGWQRCWERLMEFRKRFGHCHVPATWAEDRALGFWAVQLRYYRKRGRLSEERIRQLDDVGFVWEPQALRSSEQNPRWLARLAELEAFHQQHGHWRVPVGLAEFRPLRIWVDNQRISYRHGDLSVGRIQRLEQIGFPFKTERTR